MSIYEAEEQLFLEWQASRKGFVRDGVVSEKDYLTSNPKIAFILKKGMIREAAVGILENLYPKVGALKRGTISPDGFMG